MLTYDERNPTTHTINHQNLIISYLGEGQWKILLCGPMWKTIKEKRVMFSGLKGELIDSIKSKPLNWER